MGDFDTWIFTLSGWLDGCDESFFGLVGWMRILD